MIQDRSQTLVEDEASFERRGRELLGGSGGLPPPPPPPQKILKSRGSEMLLQAFSVAFFFKEINLGQV